MPEVKGWLSLKVSSLVGVGFKPAPRILISIPKKIVRLATRRNRIKRQVREAFRKEIAAGFKPAVLEPDKIYQFRVVQDPKEPEFNDTKDIVRRLIQDL